MTTSITLRTPDDSLSVEADYKAGALTVLLDSAVGPWAAAPSRMTKPYTVQWGPVKITLPVTTAGRKARLGKTHEWLLTQLRSFPQMTQLAEAGRIKCYTTVETEFESQGRRGVGGEEAETDAPQHMRVEGVPPAVDGTVRPARDEGEAKEAEKAFLKSITDPRFLELVSLLGPERAVEVFHLWSAEKAGVDCFLTADRKFIDAVKAARRDHPEAGIQTEVLAPSQLCARFAASAVADSGLPNHSIDHVPPCARFAAAVEHDSCPFCNQGWLTRSTSGKNLVCWKCGRIVVKA